MRPIGQEVSNLKFEASVFAKQTPLLRPGVLGSRRPVLSPRGEEFRCLGESNVSP